MLGGEDEDDRMGSLPQSVHQVELIKRLLLLSDNTLQPDFAVIGLLKWLQWMSLSAEIREATQVDKAVQSLQDHPSKQIRDFARTLNDEWKTIHHSSAIYPLDSMASVGDDGVGLPVPPMDDYAFGLDQTEFDFSDIFTLEPSISHSNKSIMQLPERKGKELRKVREVFLKSTEKQSLMKAAESNDTASRKNQVQMSISDRKVEAGSSDRCVKSCGDLWSSQKAFQKKLEESKLRLRDSYCKYGKESKRKVKVLDVRDLPKIPAKCGAKSKSKAPPKRQKMVGDKWPALFAIH